LTIKAKIAHRGLDFTASPMHNRKKIREITRGKGGETQCKRVGQHSRWHKTQRRASFKHLEDKRQFPDINELS
jgi:hypothetical protein